MARQPKKIDYTDVPQSLLDEHPFYGFQLDENQAYFVNRIWDPDTKIIFCDAKAGSGKTQMAFAVANLLYLYGRYPGGIIYVVSPYGEAKQGFLPGDIVEKSEVYFEPLYQAIVKCDLQPEKVIYNESLMTMKDKQDQVGYVKCLTHTYIRGTNFEDAVVILDESQNYSFEDLKKTLTRISDSCKVIVIGHHKQKDTDDNTDAFMRYLEYYKQMEESGEKRVSVCNLVKNYRGWISQSADDLYLDSREKKQSSEESVLYQKHLMDE